MRVVRIASVKTMYLRPMIAMQGELEEENLLAGVLRGRVVNQGDQKWSIVSDPTADAIIIRRQKGWILEIKKFVVTSCHVIPESFMIIIFSKL